MINNYPIRELKIMGRVLQCKSVQINKENSSHSLNFMILELDDYSGDQSSISVKVPCSLHPPLLNSIKSDLLLEVTGTVFYRQNYNKQILASKARVVGTRKDLGTELKWWSTVLSIRRFLVEPWAYIPAQNTIPEPTIPKFQPRALRAQREKTRALKPAKKDLNEYSTTSTSALAFAKDSVMVEKRSKRPPQPEKSDDSPEDEIMYLTDESPTTSITSANENTEAMEYPSVYEVIDLTEE